MTTETTSRQAFAARRAQERCEREGTPDRFTEHFTAECAAIRVDPPSTASLRARRPERQQQVDQVQDVDGAVAVDVLPGVAGCHSWLAEAEQ